MYKNSLILRVSMTEKPFIHKKAFANVKLNFMFHEELAKILSKVLKLYIDTPILLINFFFFKERSASYNLILFFPIKSSEWWIKTPGSLFLFKLFSE